MAQDPAAKVAKKSTVETPPAESTIPTLPTPAGSKMPTIEMPPIDPRPAENFFAEFEKEAKNLKWRYILFGILALILVGVVFLLKPLIESVIHPQPSLEQTYSPVSEEPKSMSLEINNPDDELLVFDKTLVVSGQTTPSSTIIIDNGKSDWTVQANNQGNFSQVIDLNAGINEVNIFAFDPQGNNKADSRTIYYSEQQI